MNFEMFMKALEAQERGHEQAVSTVLRATETAQAAAVMESSSRVMAQSESEIFLQSLRHLMGGN